MKDLTISDDLKFIKGFSKITVTHACRVESVTRQNLLNGKTTRENERKVRERLESEIAKLYLKED